MTSPLSPEAVAQMVADRENAMSVQDALETLSAMASVQDGYAKKATDRGLRIIHKANAKAQREVAATVTTFAAENGTLRAQLAERDATCERLREGEANLSRLLNENDRAEVAEAELATLRASEAAALERVKRMELALSDAGAMRDAADRVSQWFCTEARHLEGPRIQGLRMAIVAYDRHMQPNPALTPTADKEPKT